MGGVVPKVGKHSTVQKDFPWGRMSSGLEQKLIVQSTSRIFPSRSVVRDCPETTGRLGKTLWTESREGKKSLIGPYGW